MSAPVPTTVPAHATHDPELVAALAARPADLSDAEHATARDLVASCAACSDLLADLVALQVALPTTSTPARPRDFTLTSQDAERLRAGGWRRVLAFFGSARDSFTRPLAIGLTTMGLAGLLVATVPSIMGSGGATAGPALSNIGGPVDGGAAAAAPAASAAPLASDAHAPASAAPSIAAEAQSTYRVSAGSEPDASTFVQEETFTGSEEMSGTEQRDIAGDTSLFSIRDDGSGLSVLFVVAGVMLIAGLGLFLLRWSARRLT